MLDCHSSLLISAHGYELTADDSVRACKLAAAVQCAHFNVAVYNDC
jgi:hypothetical protein